MNIAKTLGTLVKEVIYQYKSPFFKKSLCSSDYSP